MSLITELLFWGHLLLLLVAVLAGLFLPFWSVVLLAVLHRLQLVFFDNCLLSRLQHQLGGLPDGPNFIQYALERLFAWQTTPLEGKLLDYGLVTTSLLIALIAQQLRNRRQHLAHEQGYAQPFLLGA